MGRTHRHLTQLRQVRQKSNFQLCSNIYRLQILFERPFKTFRDELDERKASSDYFKDNEILSVLYSCLLGLSQLKSLEIEHLSLRADTIFISSSGFIKLSQPKLFN